MKIILESKSPQIIQLVDFIALISFNSSPDNQNSGGEGGQGRSWGRGGWEVFVDNVFLPKQ